MDEVKEAEAEVKAARERGSSMKARNGCWDRQTHASQHNAVGQGGWLEIVAQVTLHAHTGLQAQAFPSDP